MRDENFNKQRKTPQASDKVHQPSTTCLVSSREILSIIIHPTEDELSCNQLFFLYFILFFSQRKIFLYRKIKTLMKSNAACEYL